MFCSYLDKKPKCLFIKRRQQKSIFFIKLVTAYNWAIRKVELEGEGTPTVLSYEIDPNIYTLFGLRFANIPEIPWLEFISSTLDILL